MNQTTDIYKETLATWNKVAALYQEKFMHIDLYNATYDIFCTSITMPDAKILEIGCGPGNVTKYISGKCPQWDVLAIDAAENMVELAKQNNPSSNFLVLDARDINTLGDKYDGVISGFCLPYLSASDTEKLINDSFNLLNK